MDGSREKAFDAFCAAQQDQLVRALHLMCGDLGVAEELAQTALERAWSRWDQVSVMTSPGGWVQTVALNLARSGLRRRAAERRAYARHGPVGPPEDGDIATAVAVRQALATLPARQREAVIHRFHAGRSAAETAALMGISTDAVTQLVYRARARLRDLLPDDLLSDGVLPAADVLTAADVAFDDTWPDGAGTKPAGGCTDAAGASWTKEQPDAR